MADESHVLDEKIKYKAEDHVDQIHGNNLDVLGNHLYLMGEEAYADNDGAGDEPGVEYLMANRFIKNMNILMRRNPNTPILIHMKTCGGTWEEGMAIYDMIKSCPVPVTILNYTHARSMSSIIFQAANKRVMMKNSTFMFHDGTLGIEGTVKQVESYVDFGKISTETMLDIYVENMKRRGKFAKKSKEFIRNWLREQMDKKEDVYLTAQQAVEYGLADEIFGGDGQYNWNKLTEYNEEELSRG
jgi:ATP-dependent protease ClpP protease subunit